MDFKFDFLQPDSNLYRFAEWVQRLVFGNLLWVIFTLLGLVLFGFMPSTIALFNLTNEWIKGNKNIPIFKTFWQGYKSNFLRGNLLGLFLVLMGFILYFNFNYYQQQSGLSYFLAFIVILLFVLFFLILFYIFPIYVNYKNLSLYHMVKNALLISLLSPLQTLMMFGAIILLYFGFMLLPALLPFLSVSSLVFIIMWSASQSFAKVEQKIRDHQQEEGEEDIEKKNPQPETTNDKENNS